jgi:hypothetical protein
MAGLGDNHGADDAAQSASASGSVVERVIGALPVVALGCATVATIVSVVGLVSAYGAHEARLADARHQAEAFSEEVEQDRAASVVISDVAEVTSEVDEARAMGARLASLQTGYQDVGIDDIESYAVDRVGACLSEDDQRARVPWMGKLTQRYEWRCLPACDVRGGLIPCVWIAELGDGTLVGYAHGDFEPGTGKFRNVTHVRFSSAGRYRPSEGNGVTGAAGATGAVGDGAAAAAAPDDGGEAI